MTCGGRAGARAPRSRPRVVMRKRRRVGLPQRHGEAAPKPKPWPWPRAPDSFSTSTVCRPSARPQSAADQSTLRKVQRSMPRKMAARGRRQKRVVGGGPEARAGSAGGRKAGGAGRGRLRAVGSGRPPPARTCVVWVRKQLEGLSGRQGQLCGRLHHCSRGLAALRLDREARPRPALRLLEVAGHAAVGAGVEGIARSAALSCVE